MFFFQVRIHWNMGPDISHPDLHRIHRAKPYTGRKPSLFCHCSDNLVSPYALNMVIYIGWFLNIKLTLHSWRNPNLIVIYVFIYHWIQLANMYIEYFCMRQFALYP